MGAAFVGAVLPGVALLGAALLGAALARVALFCDVLVALVGEAAGALLGDAALAGVLLARALPAGLADDDFA